MSGAVSGNFAAPLRSHALLANQAEIGVWVKVSTPENFDISES